MVVSEGLGLRQAVRRGKRVGWGEASREKTSVLYCLFIGKSEGKYWYRCIEITRHVKTCFLTQTAWTHGIAYMTHSM